jgi:hypothetical protein
MSRVASDQIPSAVWHMVVVIIFTCEWLPFEPEVHHSTTPEMSVVIVTLDHYASRKTITCLVRKRATPT